MKTNGLSSKHLTQVAALDDAQLARLADNLKQQLLELERIQQARQQNLAVKPTVNQESQKLQCVVVVAENRQPYYAVKRNVRGVFKMVLAVPPIWRN